MPGGGQQGARVGRPRAVRDDCATLEHAVVPREQVGGGFRACKGFAVGEALALDRRVQIAGNGVAPERSAHDGGD